MRTRRNPYGLAVLILFGLLATAPAAEAQRFGRYEQTESNISSYYHFVQPGTRTVQVEVIGSVKLPGLYELSEGTDLGQLVALAGGPELGTGSSTNRRTVSVYLYRPESFGSKPLYHEDLTGFITDSGSYPEMRDGDVILLEVIEHVKFGWRDALSILGALGSIAFAYDTLTRSN